MWFVYIIKCKDQTLYTGITTDTKRRTEEHNISPKGSKYTRLRRPVFLVYEKRCKDRSSASKEECRIKNLTRIEKLELIRNFELKLKKTKPKAGLKIRAEVKTKKKFSSQIIQN